LLPPKEKEKKIAALTYFDTDRSAPERPKKASPGKQNARNKTSPNATHRRGAKWWKPTVNTLISPHA